MANASSTIRVNIIGDAKKLTGALAAADGATGGLLASAGRVLVAGEIIRRGFDAVQSVIESGDRAGDAIGRLNVAIGETDAAKLDAISGSFAAIGVSAPDFLEIAAGFAEFANASGKLDADTITAMAPAVGQFAGAMARLKDTDPQTMAEAVANFISGTRGGAAAGKELGLTFDPGATAAERYALILDKLPGLLSQVEGANAGLDDKQATLNAKWDTFGKEIGPTVEGTLSNVLDVMLNIIDDIPQLEEDLGNFFGFIGDRAADALTQVLNLGGALVNLAQSDRSGGPVSRVLDKARSNSEKSVVQRQQDYDERNGQTRQKVGGV